MGANLYSMNSNILTRFEIAHATRHIKKPKSVQNPFKDRQDIFIFKAITISPLAQDN